MGTAQQELPVANYTDSALYATSPDAMADMEMGIGIPTREEQGENDLSTD